MTSNSDVRPDPKQLEQKLRRCETRKRALFDQTNDAIFLFDLAGTHFEVNERAASMLGYTVDELLSLSFRDIVHESELDQSKENFKATLGGKQFPVFQRVFKKKDGTPISVEINEFLIRDSKGAPLYIQSIVRDISERTKLEKNLRKSEERYRLLADNAKDVIFTIDMELNFTYVSPSVLDIAGYSVEEALSKNVSDILTPDSFSLVMKAMEEALVLEESVGKDGYDAPPLEVKVYHKNGSILCAEVSRVFLRNAEDKPIGILIVLRDITRRKLAEKALQISERRNREMIEFCPEGMAIVDLDERIVFANQAFASMLGYEIDELEIMSLLDVTALGEMERVQSETESRKGGRASAYQLEMIKKDGEHRIMRVSAVPWRNDEGEIDSTIAVVTDLTDRVRTEMELEASNRDLELYASLLRHDLRNDLQVILTQTEAASLLTPKDEKSIELCETTRHIAERMKQLLDVFENPEGKFISEIVGLIQERAETAEKMYSGMKISVNFDGNGRKLRVSRGRLLPALFDNLLRNSSIHAGPKVKVSIVVKREADSILIDISDNGPGISEDVRPRLFQRGVSTTGGGQGLYLCKRIAEAYGGTIQLLEPRDKSGASFRVVLPAA